MGTGPAVIVIHEVPGITPLVAEFGRKVAQRGMTAVLPDRVRDRRQAPVGGLSGFVDGQGMRESRVHDPGHQQETVR